jgi:hypothetical protein
MVHNAVNSKALSLNVSLGDFCHIEGSFRGLRNYFPTHYVLASLITTCRKPRPTLCANLRRHEAQSAQRKHGATGAALSLQLLSIDCFARKISRLFDSSEGEVRHLRHFHYAQDLDCEPQEDS